MTSTAGDVSRRTGSRDVLGAVIEALARAVARTEGPVRVQAIRAEFARDSRLASRQPAHLVNALVYLVARGRIVRVSTRFDRGVSPGRPEREPKARGAPSRSIHRYTTHDGPRAIVRATAAGPELILGAIDSLWRAGGGRPFTTSALRRFSLSRGWPRHESKWFWPNVLLQMERRGVVCRAAVAQIRSSRRIRWAPAAAWRALSPQQQRECLADPRRPDLWVGARITDEYFLNRVECRPADGDDDDDRGDAGYADRVGRGSMDGAAASGKFERHERRLPTARPVIRERSAPDSDVAFISYAADAVLLVRAAEQALGRPPRFDDVWNARASTAGLGPRSRRRLAEALDEGARSPDRAVPGEFVRILLPDGNALYSCGASEHGARFAVVETAIASWHRHRLRQESTALFRLACRPQSMRAVPTNILTARALQLEHAVATLRDALAVAAPDLELRRDESEHIIEIERTVDLNRRALVLLRRGPGPADETAGPIGREDGASESSLSGTEGITQSLFRLWPAFDGDLLDLRTAYEQIRGYCGFQLTDPRRLTAHFKSVRTIRVPSQAHSHGAMPSGGPCVFFDRVDFAIYALSRYGAAGGLFPLAARRARQALGLWRHPALFGEAMRDTTTILEHAHVAAALGILDDPESRAYLTDYLDHAMSASGRQGTAKGRRAVRPTKRSEKRGISSSRGPDVSLAAVEMAAFGLAPLPAGGVATALSPSERRVLGRVAQSPEPRLSAIATFVLEAWQVKRQPTTSRERSRRNSGDATRDWVALETMKLR